MSIVPLPKILNQESYPEIFMINVPESMIDNSLDTYPYPYRYNEMPNLQHYVDPRFVTEPQKHEYRYVNNDGVDVVIRGTYKDVMSVVDVLKTYPPKKRPCTGTDSDQKPERFDLGQSFRSRSKSAYVPDVGIQSKGDHILVKMNNKVYSGSGALIMVVQSARLVKYAIRS